MEINLSQVIQWALDNLTNENVEAAISVLPEQLVLKDSTVSSKLEVMGIYLSMPTFKVNVLPASVENPSSSRPYIDFHFWMRHIRKAEGEGEVQANYPIVQFMLLVEPKWRAEFVYSFSFRQFGSVRSDVSEVLGDALAEIAEYELPGGGRISEKIIDSAPTSRYSQIIKGTVASGMERLTSLDVKAPWEFHKVTTYMLFIVGLLLVKHSVMSYTKKILMEEL